MNINDLEYEQAWAEDRLDKALKMGDNQMIKYYRNRINELSVIEAQYLLVLQGQVS